MPAIVWASPARSPHLLDFVRDEAGVRGPAMSAMHSSPMSIKGHLVSHLAPQLEID